MAIDNFHEMKDHVANPLFQKKRALEMALETELPNDYFSKYSLDKSFNLLLNKIIAIRLGNVIKANAASPKIQTCSKVNIDPTNTINT